MDLESMRKEIAAEIQRLTRVYKALEGMDGPVKTRRLSKAGRAKISAAQKARWAKRRTA